MDINVVGLIVACALGTLLLAANIVVIILLSKRGTAKAKKPAKEENKAGEKEPLSFSKKMMLVYLIVSISLIVATVVGNLCGQAMVETGALAAASLIVDGTWGGFYLWKSKNNNRAKYAQKFVADFADKYGVDAAIRIAEVVLKD